MSPATTRECYTTLKELIIYNIHYAPEYPEEDRTDVERELVQLLRCLSALAERLRSDYGRSQLEFARRQVEEAFGAYRAGKDGREHLEAALVFVDRSKDTGPSPIDYVSGRLGSVNLRAGTDDPDDSR